MRLLQGPDSPSQTQRLRLDLVPGSMEPSGWDRLGDLVFGAGDLDSVPTGSDDLAPLPPFAPHAHGEAAGSASRSKGPVVASLTGWSRSSNSVTSLGFIGKSERHMLHGVFVDSLLGTSTTGARALYDIRMV